MNIVQKILIYFCLFDTCITSNIASWKKVNFSKNFLTNKKVPIGSKSLYSKIQCSTYCTRVENCYFWCFEEGGSCSLYNFVVSPAYETDDSETISCYTEKRRDIVFQALFDSIGIYDSESYPENLGNGIYDVSYCSFETTEPWVLVDLQKSAEIYDLIIHTAHHPFYAGYYCQFLEVRISSIAPETPGDFSSWDLFYYLDRECEYGRVEHLRPPNPKIGQYMSIKRKTFGILCLPYIEIDGIFID